jgi:hypothetical protein
MNESFTRKRGVAVGALGIAWLAAGAMLSAQPIPSGIGLVRIQRFTQEVGLPSVAGNALLQATVDFASPPASSVEAVLLTPDGRTVPLERSDTGFELGARAGTAAELLASYPSGRYTFRLVQGGSSASYGVVSSVPFQPSPSVSNLGDLQALPGEQAFTANFVGLTSQSADGVLLVDIVGDDGVVVVSSPDLGQPGAIAGSARSFVSSGVPVNGAYRVRAAVTTQLERTLANQGATEIVSSSMAVMDFPLFSPGVRGGPDTLFAGERRIRGEDGWRETPWLGRYFVSDAYPWVYVAEHGWWYASSAGGSQPRWFFDARMGWLWVDATAYPWVFRPASNWLYFARGSFLPRFFFSASESRWVTFP